MDRISAVLISGILLMMAACAVMLYDRGNAQDMKGVQAGMVCNDDTSITNCTEGRLWLRVKIDAIDGNDPGDYRITSESIADGYWFPDEEGWFYYSMPLEPKQTTRPFADAYYPAGNTSWNAAGRDAKGRFRLAVEAVDEAWLPSAPGCGMEAFDLLQRGGGAPVPEDVKREVVRCAPLRL